MLFCKSFKELAHRTAFASFCLLGSAAHAADALQKLLAVEQLLVGLSALNNYLGLPIYGEYYWLSRILKLAKVISGVALEIA